MGRDGSGAFSLLWRLMMEEMKDFEGVLLFFCSKWSFFLEDREKMAFSEKAGSP